MVRTNMCFNGMLHIKDGIWVRACVYEDIGVGNSRYLVYMYASTDTAEGVRVYSQHFGTDGTMGDLLDKGLLFWRKYKRNEKYQWEKAQAQAKRKKKGGRR